MNIKFIILALFGILSNSSFVNAEYIMTGNVGRYETKLGIFVVNNNNKPELIALRSFDTKEIINFSDFIKQVLENLKNEYNVSISRACFGVPGNTAQDRMFIQSPHLSFAVDGHELIKQNLFKQVHVINDFEIQAYGINTLDENKLIQINKGTMRKNAPKLIIGAGSGLGSALLIHNEQHNTDDILPLGACYMDFAPQTQEELEYITFLKHRIDEHIITWGKVLGSTGGVMAAYDFMKARKEYSATLSAQNLNTIFSSYSHDAQCKDVVDFYLKLYARLIRNMTYAVLPHGGVYITNTIAMNHHALFSTPEFFEQLFDCQHPFMKAMFLDIPVFINIEQNIDLYGAAQYLLQSHNL